MSNDDEKSWVKELPKAFKAHKGARKLEEVEYYSRYCWYVSR